MSEPLETMQVVDKESGEEQIINADDFDPEKHDAIDPMSEPGPDEMMSDDEGPDAMMSDGEEPGEEMPEEA